MDQRDAVGTLTVGAFALRVAAVIATLCAAGAGLSLVGEAGGRQPASARRVARERRDQTPIELLGWVGCARGQASRLDVRAPRCTPMAAYLYAPCGRGAWDRARQPLSPPWATPLPILEDALPNASACDALGRYTFRLHFAVPAHPPAGSRLVVKFLREAPPSWLGGEWTLAAAFVVDLDTGALRSGPFSEYR